MAEAEAQRMMMQREGGGGGGGGGGGDKGGRRGWRRTDGAEAAKDEAVEANADDAEAMTGSNSDDVDASAEGDVASAAENDVAVASAADGTARSRRSVRQLDSFAGLSIPAHINEYVGQAMPSYYQNNYDGNWGVPNTVHKFMRAAIPSTPNNNKATNNLFDDNPASTFADPTPQCGCPAGPPGRPGRRA